MAKKVTTKPARLTQKAPVVDDEARLEHKEPVLEDGVEDGEEDYLQKYQYMREKPLGHPDSNPREGKAKLMKDNLLTQSRVTVMIPVDSGSDASVPFSVQLNGYRLDLPRNQYIAVPEQVAEIIQNSHNQTVAALSRDRIDGDSRKESALG